MWCYVLITLIPFYTVPYNPKICVVVYGAKDTCVDSIKFTIFVGFNS